ncbi:breast cancer anti-estrogen resistance protein 3 homolog isoform X2 [Dysidea avara]|uniref:breast cancer anti-estrogen resistance protein 3 homolog isoform X2 n=1 Tax=Dysidea avara TaxID=196820 RepID=UPI00333329DF
MTRLKHLITGGSKKEKKKASVPPVASASSSTPHQSKMMISEPIPVKVRRHNVDETRDISLKQGDKPVSVVKPMNSESPPNVDPVLEKYGTLRSEHRSTTPESPVGTQKIKKEMSRSCNNLSRSSIKQTSPDREGIPVTKMSVSRRPFSREGSVTRRSPMSDVVSPTGIRSTSFSGEYGRHKKSLGGSKENSSEHINQGGLVTYRSNDASKQASLSAKHSSVASSESGLSVGFDSEEDYSTTLEAQPWYHGRMNATVSEMLVHRDGDFLVWETQSKPTSYILTLYWDGRPQHVQIDMFEVASSNSEASSTKKPSFKYHFDNGAFDSIPELVHNHLKYQIPVSKFSDGVITNPISRPNSGVKELEHQPIQRSYTVSSPYGVARKKYGSSQNLQRNSTDPAGIYASYAVPPMLHHMPELSEERGYGFYLPQYRVPSESALNQMNGEEGHPRNRMKYDPLYESLYISEQMAAAAAAGGSHYYLGHPYPPNYYNLLPAQLGPNCVPYSTTSLRRPKKKMKSQAMYSGTQYGMTEDDEKRISMFGTMRKSKSGKVEKAAASSTAAAASVGNLSVTTSDTDTVVGDQELSLSASDIFSGQRRDTIIHNLATPKHQSRSASIDSDYVYMEGIKPTPFAMAFFEQAAAESEGENKDSPLLNRVKKQSVPHPFASSSSSTPETKARRTPSPTVNNKSSTTIKCQSELNRVEQMFVAYHVEELAQHLTLADAVLMQFIPRPRETEAAYWERLKKEGACDGQCVGLEMMGLPEGEKLWNKLMNRHQSLSQWVKACIVCSEDIEERAKVIAKFVELARALQSTCFGNIFSFVAVMTGLASSQVSGLSHTWLEFHSTYPELSDTYNNQLVHTFSALRAGAKVFALEYVSIPAVQCLGDTYVPKYMPGDSSGESLDSLLEEFSNFSTNLDCYRNLLSHCASYSYNSRKRLSNYKYQQTLFEYFLQDHPKQILHRMDLGVNLEDPSERKRRFSVILQALAERT